MVPVYNSCLFSSLYKHIVWNCSHNIIIPRWENETNMQKTGVERMEPLSFISEGAALLNQDLQSLPELFCVKDIILFVLQVYYLSYKYKRDLRVDTMVYL